MSDSSSGSRSSSSGRQRRSGGKRRRSGGNRNRSNRNRDRVSGGGDGGGGGSSSRGGGGQRGRRSGGSRRSGGPRRSSKPAPLTFWQKILKAIGLYDPDKPKKRTSPSRVPRPPESKGKKVRSRVKSGTRQATAESVPVESTRLYVGNLSYDATEVDLSEVFKGTGTVKSVEIVYNNSTHRSKGFGFVTMSTIEEAQRAVDTLHDQPFMDRQMIVSGSKSTGPAKPREVPPKEETFDLADKAETSETAPDEMPAADQTGAEEPAAEEPALDEPAEGPAEESPAPEGAAEESSGAENERR
jgi:hypothetical protein